MTYFHTRTAAGYVSRSSLTGPMATDAPAQFAYCFHTFAEAEAIADSLAHDGIRAWVTDANGNRIPGDVERIPASPFTVVGELTYSPATDELTPQWGEDDPADLMEAHQQYQAEMAGVPAGQRPTFEEWLNAPDPVDTDTCPEHGEQEVIGYGQTRGADPYSISVLACGHSVACFGPGEPNVILRSSAKRHP